MEMAAGRARTHAVTTIAGLCAAAAKQEDRGRNVRVPVELPRLGHAGETDHRRGCRIGRGMSLRSDKAFTSSGSRVHVHRIQALNFTRMRRTRLILALAAALCAALPVDAVTQDDGAASDRAALVALYDVTDGANWEHSTNWKTSAPLGDWHGVTTDADGRVTVLELNGNSLTGELPAALGNLSNLNRLIFINNKGLTGPIPAALGNLSNLRSLILVGNALTGPIPAALATLPRLSSLNLSGNALSGPIPASLGNLSGLSLLSLSGNALSGPIPASLGNLSGLRWLNLSGNALSGPIPSALTNLSSLEELHLSYNWGLSGSLPSGLQQIYWLDELNTLVTRTCAPAAWRGWLRTIDFIGRPCEAGPDVTIDVAVFYTRAARDAAGGTAEIEAAIDLMVARDEPRLRVERR